MSSLTELASGVDSLYVSARCSLPARLLDRMESTRAEAQDDGQSRPFPMGGYDWQLQGRSLNRYRYRLDHPLATIGATTSANLPALYVQFRAEGLHSIGPDGVLSWLHSALTNEELEPRYSVSRIDLHADWQGWELDGDDRRRFVCRSRELTTHEDDLSLTGFSFGKRKSKTLTARIYDKTIEIEGNGHDWWRDKWGTTFDPDGRVLRTEFEFHRNALTEMGLDTPTETLDEIGGLWAYATRDWLTFRQPSRHGCPDRWPIAPEWTQVQQASLAGAALPLDRIASGRQRGELRRMMPALNGYVAGFAAWTGHDTIEDACAALPEHLHAYERRSGRAFCSRVAEKRGQIS